MANKATKLAFSLDDEDFKDFLPEDSFEVMMSAWTDFNVKDPGVALLEAIIFTMQDLEYKYSHPIYDLLEGEHTNGLSYWNLRKFMAKYAASENDYRRLLGTMPEVLNAVILPTKAEESEPGLSCLLNVWLAMVKDKKVPAKVEKELLHKRGLGEYFNRQEGADSFVNPDVFKIEVSLKITSNSPQITNKQKEKVHTVLSHYLLPKLNPVDFRNLIANGYHMSHVFSGPYTANEDDDWQVIDPQVLSEPCFRKYIVASKLCEVVTDLPFVASVEVTHLGLTGDPKSARKGVLNLGKHGFTSLDKLIINGKDLVVEVKSETPDTGTSGISTYMGPKEISGKYRKPRQFNTIQQLFPPNFRLGKHIAASGPENEDPTISFRTFLALLDKIRTNVNSQIAALPGLFSQNPPTATMTSDQVPDHHHYTDLKIVSPFREKNIFKKLEHELEEQRLNYLLGLAGHSPIKEIPHLSKHQNLNETKSDYLKLLHTETLSSKGSSLNSIFQSQALLFFQAKVETLLSTDVGSVRIMEHCFLQPVASRPDHLDFEITAFIFLKGDPFEERDQKEQVHEFKNFTKGLVRQHCPAHIIPHIRWKNEDHISEFDQHLKEAFPPGEIFFFDKPISASQKESMLWLYKECELPYPQSVQNIQ